MKILRRIGTWLVATAIIASQIPCTTVSAAGSAQESQLMQDALLEVKEKLEIPAEFEDFTSEYETDNEERLYNFNWSRKDDSYTSIDVQCDTEGRIRNYYYYGSDYEDTYIGVDNTQAIEYAGKFLKKIAPEAFADENDKYMYEDCYAYFYTGNSSYTVSFERYRNGNKVRSNGATVTVDIYGDEMQVQSAIINYKYDAVFEDVAQELTEAESEYKKLFPLEMVYSDYSKKTDGEYESDVYLVYRTKDAGYMSAYTGAEVSDAEEEYMPYTTSNTMAKAETADLAGGARLTEAELAEIDKVSNLISEEDCVRYFKTIPMIGFDELDIAAYHTNLYATDEERSEYTRSFSYHDATNDRYLNLNVDAVRGDLIYFSDTNQLRYKYNEDAMVSDETLAACETLMDEFLGLVVAPEIMNDFELQKSEDRSQKQYVRKVNGIVYNGDSIYVECHPQTAKLARYTFNYNYNAEFVDPASAIAQDAAYDIMLEAAPLEKAYVKFKDGYKLVYYLSNTPMVDAVAGEVLTNYAPSTDPADIEYSDIDNHWSKEKVEFLKGLGIALDGPELRPDEPITQLDIIKVLGAAASGMWFVSGDADEVYENAYKWEIIDESERNDSAPIKREEAFRYMVYFMNYDKVAKLPEIYKVSYADGDMLSDGMIGYAAILSGMGVISGDGSVVRPQDYITRAEALSMAYNYLTSPLR